tara:strand:+ start:44 stop:328 length:285 start_codon:yes stop_codon:yes gene_type:complete
MVKVSEISGGRGIPTIPVFDRTVVGLQEAEQTSVGTVSYRMTANLDTVARLHVVQGDTDTFEPLATSRLQGPDLGLSLSVGDFQIDPGMGDEKV